MLRIFLVDQLVFLIFKIYLWLSMQLSSLLIIINVINNKMNASFVMISILVKSNLTDKCLINALYSIDSKALRNYLGIVEIYDGNSGKSKSDLIEIIVYGYIKDKLKRDNVSDVSLSSAFKILKDKGINVISLPGYGNMKLSRKDIVSKYKNNILLCTLL